MFANELIGEMLLAWAGGFISGLVMRAFISMAFKATAP